MQLQHKRQSGFIILMGMLVMVLGAAIWFGIKGQVRSNTMLIEQNDKHIAQLHKIKQKMLAYTALHPEIYSDATNVPGPGYFPCPDENDDGSADTNCGSSGVNNSLFVLGQVPFSISSRNYSFLDSLQDRNLFWYAVDSRYVNSSAAFTYAGLSATTQRFASLNNDTPNEVEDSSGSDVSPMTVDGKDDIVMVLFYAGKVVFGQNRAGNATYTNYLEQGTYTDGLTHNFVSVDTVNAFNDYVITITRKEWESAVLSRLAQDINPEDGQADLCTIPVDQPHWFNECQYVGTNIPPFNCTNTTINANENIVGQNWRDIAC